MFECLTGRSPFTGETSLSIAYQHLTARVPVPSSLVRTVPPVLDRAVRHATEKDRADRPQSARAMRDEVARAGIKLNGSPTVADLARELPDAADEAAAERAPTVTIPRAETPRARRHRRLRRWTWRLVLLAVLAVAGWATWAYAIPHYANVPPVRGLSLQQAQTRLESAGFDVAVAPKGVADLRVGVGDVAKTVPPIGARTRTGTTIVLYPSTGPPFKAVPDVRGMQAELARQKLARSGFTNIVPRQVYSARIEKGFAIGTLPAIGQRIRVSDLLTLQISRGPPPVAIPDLRGQKEGEAKKALKDLGFTASVTHDFSVDVPKGYVIATKPPKGTKLQIGKTVTLVVSKGPKTFPMPNVVNESVDVAKSTLQRLGLNVRVVVIGSGSKIVLAQSPSAGATAYEGESVTIYVAQ